MLDRLNALFQALAPLWEMSITAAYAAAIVIVLRLLLKKRAPKQVLCLLWLVVFARLLLPVSLESPLSIVPDALPGQQEALSGHNSSVLPQDPAQNQAGSGSITPAVNDPVEPSLAAPEGAAPAASAPETPAPFPWQAVLAGIWQAGAAAMMGSALLSYLRLRRRLFDAIRAKDGAWEHPAVDSPFILGMLRPRIYLPVGLVGRPRKFILCHERAHLRRFDHIVKPVCWIALALHWFNPLVWAAFILMSRDIESACDEAVIRRLGSAVKADYSTTLLALATGRRAPSPCPLAFDEGDARGRIQNVLRYRRPALWVIVVSAVAAVLAAVCLLTDPVAAKESVDNPGPDASTSQEADNLANPLLEPWTENVLDGPQDFISTDASQEPDNLADTLLDPWMETVLEGRQDFTSTETGEAVNIALLDGAYPSEFTVTLSRLAIVDLDRDGISELILWPSVDGDDSLERISSLGYLILRRQGDAVYSYQPSYRAFTQIKTDGTFFFSGGAAYSGYASIQFQGDEFVLHEITYCDGSYDEENEFQILYFVDGRKAAQEEFEAAIASQNAKPDAAWYTYGNGVLTPCLPNGAEPADQSGPVDDINAAAPLDAPLDTALDIPDDPEQWYKVAELPDDMIGMFSRNYGSETLIRWGEDSYKLFDHTAHTGQGIMPELKRLGGAGTYGPLAVISNVASGASAPLFELVVYDLDAPDAVDYSHDCTPLRYDFNQNCAYQYNAGTHTLAYTYQGQTVEALIEVDDDIYRRIDQEGLSLRATDNNVAYWFDRVNDGNIYIELPIQVFIGDDTSPVIFPGWVRWSLRFNGSGFDTIPGSCELTYPGSAYQ